ncbi:MULTISPECIES: outer membrane protein [Microbulbifer]|uniref:outer membrane protein n=1 Tax=Microbulbifer TaxID=48073 RepID=UPI001E2A8BD0|nr:MULTISPECIES: outer membrane beta-barrel protein [Microbulbifer]UHQ53816.1 outer membrane beta-barrel protein [Microbulbifer sp. YPW16]
MISKKLAMTALAAALASVSAHAEDFYISGSVSWNDMDDIDTDGRFTGDFVTGEGVAIPSGVVIPRGTRLRWDTDIDSSWGVQLAAGWRMREWRFEVEYAWAEHDVESHKNVRVGGANIDGVDAAVLLTGQLEPLGVTVGELVDGGQGDVSTDFVFFNAYYDFDTGTQWQPYLGAGLGNAWVDVDYKPSDVRIVDDDDSVFAWQLMGGINYLCTDELTYFGGLRWRETDDAEVRSRLLPADFDIDTESLIVEIGARWHF